ncbi:MAG: HAMP domain-containing sensor histidine kinase [Hyphomicrobiaceae bacterium]
MPSSAVKAETPEASPQRIVDAVGFLARERACSMAWLDEELRILQQFGPLTAELGQGATITSSLDVLLGLDEELAALKLEPERNPLAIPNVLPPNARSRGERMTLTIYWIADEKRYLLLITRAASFADIEYRLAAEVRARAIAEAEVAAQARVVQRINQELASANRDLQEFASVISHDLRAPLRGLRYAAMDAKTALGQGDTRKAATDLDSALSLARRMSGMLTGLLDYARVGRKVDAAEPVDTGELVASIVESIASGSGHSIHVEGEWPTLVTVAEPLDIILRNLIDNAVKHHDRQNGCIRVRAEQEGGRLLVSVTDDGPGIEPAWHEAIFLPFRQLVDADEADGAGIGLALVKKTVERFGGAIEVQSDPSRARGTTFRVAWPLTLSA